MRFPFTDRFCLGTGLALVLFIQVASAETIRVATWNLDPVTVDAARATNQDVIHSAALILQPLDADILLVQGVRDWQLCAALAKALKPANYNVVVCSSLRESPAGAP